MVVVVGFFISPSAGITRIRFNGSACGSLSRARRPLSLSAPRLLYHLQCNPVAPYAQPPPATPETINSPSMVVAAVISPP